MDPLTYSGGNARIYGALQKHVGEVTVLDPGWGWLEPLRKLVDALPEAITIRLRWRLHLLLGRFIARALHQQLKAGQYDVVFGAYAFHTLAGLRVPPGTLLAYTSDATPTTYKQSEIGESFGSFLRVSRLLDPLVLQAERQVFRKADLLLWPTEWLKSGADALYGLNPDNSCIIPWGANIADPAPLGSAPEVSQHVPLRFVLIGRDWFAKGGPLVFDTIALLRAKGIDAQLDVIGVDPPDFHRADHVHVHGLLNKSNPKDFARFETVLRAAHFLFQPSFESYGFAFCEASAYGLPSLCLRIGGVPVRNGINGFALPQNAGPEDFATEITRLIDAPETYQTLRQTARKEYEERLNWDAWGRHVDQLLNTFKP